MVSHKEILNELDSSMIECTFPLLDTIDFDISQSRLSVYKNQENYLIAIEMVGTASLGIVNELFLYGNCIDKTGIIMSFDNVILVPGNEESIYDDDGEFVIKNPNHFTVKIWDKEISFSVGEEDFKKTMIDPVNFTPLLLTSICSDKLWLKDDWIFEQTDLTGKFPIFYRTEEWNHPINEMPSENHFFQQLAKAIEQNHSSLIKVEKPNTHWSQWTEYDFDNLD